MVIDRLPGPMTNPQVRKVYLGAWFSEVLVHSKLVLGFWTCGEAVYSGGKACLNKAIHFMAARDKMCP